MSEFSDLMAAGLAQTVAEIPTKFTFRNKSFTGIYQSFLNRTFLPLADLSKS